MRSNQAYVTSRSGGENIASYTASRPVLGQTLTATVDLSTTGHDAAAVFGYAAAASVPFRVFRLLVLLMLRLRFAAAFLRRVGFALLGASKPTSLSPKAARVFSDSSPIRRNKEA